MKELIFHFVNQYALWGILIFTGISMLLLWRVLSQQKRLNRSLGLIVGNIQAYFDVILKEEPEELPVREVRREERFLTGEEREPVRMRGREQTPEEEEVFQAVMQEFFS